MSLLMIANAVFTVVHLWIAITDGDTVSVLIASACAFSTGLLVGVEGQKRYG